MKTALAFLVPILAFVATIAEAGPFGLVLPTDNDAIFSSNPENFYMYTDRNFEGVSSQPWTGGTYGFSRNGKRTRIGVINTRLHEGIDIRPVYRDSNNEPLDEIRSMSDGTVVYINASASGSNYGKYIVVHHDWGDGPFFSLYAHLSSAVASIGQKVRAGETIAKMGYTGAGINRTRAHVHVELNMIMSDRFQSWYDLHFTSKNNHGIYNGFNMTGTDIAALLKAHRANPGITMPEFLLSTNEVHYRVRIPGGKNLAILRRYPWLGRDLGSVRNPKSWEFAFAATGVPLSVRPSSESLSYPTVFEVKPTSTDHSYLTVGRITGTGRSAKLTPSGSRYMQLISDSF